MMIHNKILWVAHFVGGSLRGWLGCAGGLATCFSWSMLEVKFNEGA